MLARLPRPVQGDAGLSDEPARHPVRPLARDLRYRRATILEFGL